MQIENREPEIRLTRPGRCNWCGKLVIGYESHYCSKSCFRAFSQWWTDDIPAWKRTIYLWDDFTCQICHVRPLTVNPYGLVIPDLRYLAIDHIMPVARGGKTEWDNLQVLCNGCNQFKKARNLTNNGILRLKAERDTELASLDAYLNSVIRDTAK